MLILLIRISSFIATILLLGIPLVLVLAIPNQSVAFLSHQHAVFGDGLIPINNLHILLFIWSALIAIILYTEFITWYLGRGEGEGAGAESAGAGAPMADKPAADDLAGSDEPAGASGFPDESLIGDDGGFPGDFGMDEESELGDFDGFPG